MLQLIYVLEFILISIINFSSIPLYRELKLIMLGVIRGSPNHTEDFLKSPLVCYSKKIACVIRVKR